MATCLIGIGANLGDPAAQINSSVELLRRHAGIQVVAVSGYHRTRPVGGPPDQDDFLNAVVRATTSLPPRQLLDKLQRIEQKLGRRRDVRWGPRTVDLDLLLYDNLVVKSEELELPHPRMAFRRFVIEPACEIAAEMVHPRICWTLAQIASHLETSPDYIAVTGVKGSGKSALILAVAERTAINMLAEDALDHDTKEFTSTVLAERECQIMRRRSDVLRTILQKNRQRPKRATRFSLTDFWFDQSAAYIACNFSGQVQAELLNELHEYHADIPRPKLLVVLTRSLPGSTDVAAGKTADTDLTCIQQQLVELSQHPGRGPTLWLDAEFPELAASEVVAAVEALRV